MKSTTALWFDIEATFAEIERLCIEALAAELAVSWQEQEARQLRTAVGGTRISLLGDEPRVEEDRRAVRGAEMVRDPLFRDAHRDGADLVELRAHLRKLLTSLKSKLAEVLPDHEVYYALFPIVVYCDELMNGVTKSKLARWEPLQSELYEIDNGGELFYSILEERLRQAETHPIVFEVFYFCLSDGFVGMYQGDPKKIEEYKARLRERIPCKPLAAADATARGGSQIELVEFPWRYYVTAALAVVAGYVLLSVLAPSA